MACRSDGQSFASQKPPSSPPCDNRVATAALRGIPFKYLKLGMLLVGVIMSPRICYPLRGLGHCQKKRQRAECPMSCYFLLRQYRNAGCSLQIYYVIAHAERLYRSLIKSSAFYLSVISEYSQATV